MTKQPSDAIIWRLFRYNNVYKGYAIIGLFLIASVKGWAQYDVSFSHYWAMEPSFNPAAVGKEAKLNIAAAYAIQMAGFEHNVCRSRYALLCHWRLSWRGPAVS